MGEELLKGLVVIDYQNIHLTARDKFAQGMRPGDVVIDPILFAMRGVERRNAAQREGYPHAELERIEVYRGQPSPTHDPVLASAAMAQKSHWERHPKTAIFHRPLRYPTRGGAVIGPGEEKGVDVLCALAVVDGIARYDLVMLASHDTDLEPVLDHARLRGKIETLGWRGAKRIKPTRGGAIWDTRLGYEHFQYSLDPRRKQYFPADG